MPGSPLLSKKKELLLHGRALTLRKSYPTLGSKLAGRYAMNSLSGEIPFLALCERLFALSLEEAALRTRAAQVTDEGDTSLELAEAIEDNTVERRLILWRLCEMTRAAPPQQR